MVALMLLLWGAAFGGTRTQAGAVETATVTLQIEVQQGYALEVTGAPVVELEPEVPRVVTGGSSMDVKAVNKRPFALIAEVTHMSRDSQGRGFLDDPASDLKVRLYHAQLFPNLPFVSLRNGAPVLGSMTAQNSGWTKNIRVDYDLTSGYLLQPKIPYTMTVRFTVVGM